MRFLHLGDIHIGKSLGEFNLLDDQKYIFDEIIRIGKENGIDAVMIAGDVYDKAIPSEGAVGLFDYFINSLSSEGFKTYVISGNHDSDARLNFGSRLFEAKDIYISAKYNGTLYKQVEKDEYGDVNIYLLPFVKASNVRQYYPEEKIENYENAVETVIKNADINKNERNILVAHQFVVAGEKNPVLSGSEGAGTKMVGNVEKIRAGVFDDFDYVALGHIHSAQHIGRNEVRYSGSPLKYSLSEANDEKTVTMVDINEKGNVSVRKIPLQPRRDLRHIKGKMENLLKKENIVDEEDYMYVTLTDEDFINDAMGIIQNYYPNTVKVDYDNSRTKEIENIDIEEITKDKSFDEIISEFYSKIYGLDIDEEELKYMMDAAREAKVTDETY